MFAAPLAFAAKFTSDPARPRVGEVALVTVSGVSIGPGETASARLLDHEFPLRTVREGELTGLVAVERDAKPGSHKLEILLTSGKTSRVAQVFKVKVTSRKFEEQWLKVDQKTVELSMADEERALKERELIAAAIAGRTSEFFYEAGFERPLEGRVSSTFGLKRFYNGKARSYHGGLDIAAPAGEVVRSSSEGVVAISGDFFFTGNSVFVDHGQGLYTAYFHMESRAVEAGQKLAKGGVVGRVGSTGRSTGPHLHWSVYLCGVKVDPESLLKVALDHKAP